MFSKILIANRGEIAVRIIRTARLLGYPTVAIYSTVDAASLHVQAADEAVHIGPSPATSSYLAIDKVIAAARASGADAIHPGYGFLAENADFARACAEAEITFIGPPVEAIELMGNKRAAKAAMLEASVPCIPGYQGEDQSDGTLKVEAERIGFPVMVKAAAGGGGRGMRLVDSLDALDDALRSARAEAASAFGSDELIIEKAVLNPRHVELQVFGDAHGNVVHLGERDCSVQRRHQKVIEECPSPAVDQALRERMGAAAIEVARACNYVGAGTVEFLLDSDSSFFFLEMNTRLQVEHPVTELVTGLDLVDWQLRVAAGEPLPLGQEQISLSGHAIEARLYAEDPSRGFMPQTGKVLAWSLPESVDIRVDHGVREGGSISPFYDPMIGKLIAHGRSRDDARRKLVSALRETTLLGLRSNKAFLANVCEHPAFAAGEATTSFLTEQFAADASMQVVRPDSKDFALAALVVFLEGARGVVEDESFIGWRSGGPQWATIKLECDDHDAQLQVTATGRGAIGRGYQVVEQAAELDPTDEATTQTEQAAAEPIETQLEVVGQRDGRLQVVVDGVAVRLRYALDGATLWLDDGHRGRRYDNTTHVPAVSADAPGSGQLVAALDGAVMKLFVEQGAQVETGQLLLVMEAMKMEHRILADVCGTVSAVHVAQGDQVKTRQLLVEIAPAEEGGA